MSETTIPAPVHSAAAELETAGHDHAWRSLTVGTVLTYSEYQCSLCGITWSL